MVYDINGTALDAAYNKTGERLAQAFDIDGNELLEVLTGDVIYDSAHSHRQLYAGGYIEIQPDSWDGSTVCTGDIVQPTDPTAWGFPMSLSSASKTAIKNEILPGNGFGISFIRFPMGFAYRGYRNIDAETGLAKNIGQRWDGQNSALNSWFFNIAQAGGGLSVEYWCPAPYWLTGGAYYNPDVNNELWAGGTYSRTTTLESIKSSDPEQYASQIDAFTDAIVNDLEYVHQNVAPVRMYTLATEPTGSGQLKYGHCHWTSDVYNDVFAVLHPKVMASQILATYNSKANVVLMHLCADHTGFTIGEEMLTEHTNWIWGYSHDVIHDVSGDRGNGGADTIKALNYPQGSSPGWSNVFICEYEYFTSQKEDNFRCANNIVRMILEMVYRKARVVMPVIHICKPTGQTSSQTNTAGYSMFPVTMEDGSYTVNPWSYNSWKMINDNLPVGSALYKGGDGDISLAGYAVFKKDGKTYILMGNYASVSASFSFTFDKSYSFTGKKYDINNVGTTLTSKSGSSVTFDLSAYSGCFYVCNDDVNISSVIGDNGLDWDSGYINDNGILVDNIGAYIEKGYTPASGSITITVSDRMTIRIAEYDANKNFIQRKYVERAISATFNLSASTAYVRVGFNYYSPQNEETVTALFDGGYTITN